MAAKEQGYIVVNDPFNPNRMVRARLLEYQTIRGEDYLLRLRDGSTITLNVQIESVSRPIEPQTGKPLVNPITREPVYHVRWGMRVNTTYSEAALNEARGENM
jgi:hypothetical protein